MSKIETNKVPPDGGYGWIVTIAYAMNNVSTYTFYQLSPIDYIAILVNTLVFKWNIKVLNI